MKDKAGGGLGVADEGGWWPVFDSNEEALETAATVSRKEGLLVGISSGANIFAGMQIAKRCTPDQRILVIVCDTGERYISTDLFR